MKRKALIIGVLMCVVLIAGTRVTFAQMSTGAGLTTIATGAAAGATAGFLVGGPFGAGVLGIVGAGIGLMTSLFGQFNLIAITSGILYYVFYGLAYAMGWIAAGVFYLGGALVDIALEINLGLLNSPLIQMGSSIILGFANLAFILVIIVIAFATMFRMESYAMKQTLWKLVVAALLVNFSLVIAGAFINVSHLLTEYFTSQIEGTAGGGISTYLASVLNPQFLLTKEDFNQSISQAFKEINKEEESKRSSAVPAIPTSQGGSPTPSTPGSIDKTTPAPSPAP